ncbi:hypothetical protein, partial [Acidiphilium sp. 37-64-53]|uniref:hypothetical protein n=1 Tax=Acidiphilium sp. 37-64-53 TaxID=1970299 RepID=UPI00257D4D14
MAVFQGKEQLLKLGLANMTLIELLIPDLKAARFDKALSAGYVRSSTPRLMPTTHLKSPLPGAQPRAAQSTPPAQY